MSMENLLSALYKKENPAADSIEKTAEATLLEHLQGRGQVAEENPYASMSDEEFLKIAMETLSPGTQTETAPEKTETDEVLEKVAADALGGKIMAHSFWHELGLAKQAMLNGQCRVCKEHPMDVEGQSICSSCQATGTEDKTQQDS